MTMKDLFDEALTNLDKKVKNDKKEKRPDLRVYLKAGLSCQYPKDGRKQKSCLYYWRRPSTGTCMFLDDKTLQCLCLDT